MCLSAYSYFHIVLVLTIASVKSHKWILNKIKVYDTIEFCDLFKK
jgi:hypothetical protein